MHSIDFPIDVPKPATMLSAEATTWYLSATARIEEFIERQSLDMAALSDAWSARSRLRYAAAMALIDQDAAAEFIQKNPLPNVESLLELARHTSPSDPVPGALQLLLHPPTTSASDTLRAVNDNVAYADIVMPNGQASKYVETDQGWKTVRHVLPPRPAVPNPEYIQSVEPFFCAASIWKAAPQIAVSDSTLHDPCTLVHSNSLWLSYLTDQDEKIAVVRFSGYVEHQISRIGRLLESHPYFNAGLTAQAFNELSNSLHTKYWGRFSARHWVINFSDRTIDVIAQDVTLVEVPMRCNGTLDSMNAAITSADD
ncbi:MAG: hypothetical protein RIS44_243 [Pseudomonadota bacterium]|jgi:hypothetical protein